MTRSQTLLRETISLVQRSRTLLGEIVSLVQTVSRGAKVEGKVDGGDGGPDSNYPNYLLRREVDWVEILVQGKHDGGRQLGGGVMIDSGTMMVRDD